MAMADHQHKKQEKTVMGYPADPGNPLLPVSWPPPSPVVSPAAAPSTTIVYHSPDGGSTLQTLNPTHMKEIKYMKWWDPVQVVLAVLFCVLLLGVGVLSFYFGYFVFGRLRPSTFGIESLTVDAFNVSSSHITTNWSIVFSIRNPNYGAVTQYYQDVKASVFYKDEYISFAKIEPFFPNPEGKTSVPTTTGVHSVRISGSVAEDIAADWSNGAANFTVTVNATVRTDPATDEEQKIEISVLCEGVRVGFSSENKTEGTIILDGSRKCKSKWVPDEFYSLSHN